MKYLPTKYFENRRKYILFENDCGVSDVAKKGNIYENHIYKYLQDININSTNIVDIGANFGFHTIEFANLVGENGNVYSFEPQKHIFYQLCGNVILNGLTNVTCYDNAIGRVNGSIKMENVEYFSPRTINIGNSHVERCIQQNNFNVCQEKRLDDFNFNNVSVIKIDVQGYELFVLEGAIRTILTNNPIIFIEIEPCQLELYNITREDVINFFKKNNYICEPISHQKNNVDYIARKH